MTGNGCRASNSAAPFQAGAYTVTVPAGSRVASACTNDWMPPRRGGKSLVTISVRGTGRVYRGEWPWRAGRARATGYGRSAPSRVLAYQGVLSGIFSTFIPVCGASMI